MHFRFIQDAFRTLVDTLKQTTNADFSTSAFTKLAVFVVFIVLIVVSYLIIWTPFVNRLNRDVSKTPTFKLSLFTDLDH